MGMIRKTLPLADCQVKMVGKGRFSGYASVFNGVDSYGDTIAPGAYAETLKNHAPIKMFFNHESWELPIGRWTKVEEDSTGLYVEGELTKGASRANDVGAALEHGTVDGLSVGFMLASTDFEWKEDGGRLIKRVSRLVETSVATFPADGAARIDLDSVKSEEIEAIVTVRDFEVFLRDAGGLSKGLARALAARAKTLFAAGPQGDDDATVLRQLAERVGRLQTFGVFKHE